MKRYEIYKNSGVDWIGEIPEEWEVKKLKFLGKIYAGINGKKGDDFSKEFSVGVKSFIPFTNICNNFKIDDNNYQYVKIDDSENQNRVKKNDILFLMSSETLDDIAKNSIYLGNNEELYLNSFCKGFRIFDKDVEPEFINYLLLSSTYRNYFSLVGRGFTRINLKQEYINDVSALLPNLKEQQTIALFLDEKTAKIDQTISIKEKEILLLKERRQILIQKAVTKGLNPNVKLKNSGVDWIGEIPEHWETLSNKYIFYLNKIQVGKKSSDYELLSLTLSGIIKRDMENPEGKFPAEFDTYQEVKKGDFVFCLFDVEETPRTVGLSNFDGMITGAYTVMKVNSHFNSKFLYYYYLNLDEKKRLKYLYKGLRNTIPKDIFFALKTIIPPISEQIEITNYLDIINEKISKAISLKQQEIEKLKECKTVLVDNVVTGKVRV